MEPHELYKRYLVLPTKVDRRTTEGKNTWFKYMKIGKGKKLVNRDIYITAVAMTEAVLRHPIAAKLFATGKAEEIFTFTDPDTKIKCKIRTDWRTPDDYLVDLKSAKAAWCDLTYDGCTYDEFGQIIPQEEDGGPVTTNIYKGFPKSIFDYRYDVQDCFYSDGFYLATGRRPKGFIFVAVEKKPPFDVNLYILSHEIRVLAREKYRRNLAQYKRCKELNQWPVFSNKIITIK